MKVTFSSPNYSSVSFSAANFIKKDVLVKCLKKGMSNREIAAYLSVNEHTVGRYLKQYDLKPTIKTSMANMKEMINSSEYARCTLRELEEKTGISGKTILKWRKNYNVPTSREVRRGDVLQLFNDGFSVSEIIDITKMNRTYVSKILAENGFNAKKIHEMQLQKRIDLMTDYYKKGMNIPQMAKEMGIEPSALRQSEKKYFGKHVFKMHKKTK